MCVCVSMLECIYITYMQGYDKMATDCIGKLRPSLCIFFLVHLLSSLSFRLHFHRLSSLSSVSLYFIELIPILLFLHSYIPRGSCFPPSLPLSTLFSALALVVVFDPPSSPPPPLSCYLCIVSLVFLLLHWVLE